MQNAREFIHIFVAFKQLDNNCSRLRTHKNPHPDFTRTTITTSLLLFPTISTSFLSLRYVVVMLNRCNAARTTYLFLCALLLLLSQQYTTGMANLKLFAFVWNSKNKTFLRCTHSHNWKEEKNAPVFVAFEIQLKRFLSNQLFELSFRAGRHFVCKLTTLFPICW